MECNKEDAMKAKELAEKKILEIDLAATIEVYVSAERRINGEVDWYRVLGVDPMVDDETIRRHYRKLCSSSCTHEETPYGKPSVPAGGNGFYNSFHSANWRDRDPRSFAHPNPPHIPPVTPKQTFWTMCSFCRAQFEYPSAYLNCNLAYMFCRRLFVAIEVPTPSIHSNTSSTSTGRIKKTPAKNLSKRLHRSSPFSLPSGISSVPTPTSFSGTVSNGLRVSSQNLKRGREDKTPPVVMEEAYCGKTQAVNTSDAGSAFQSSCFGSNSILKRDRPRKKKGT
ncbi:uncharacterized protein LOC129319752 [Prosopis cineraria]|uniref:uncharacterized protein LOC129319752 n=1 Tax=Prosopis cineraria TaxID=364024 RepID=UPI0024104EA1|nr:uncharacterized protein LOC129319752 [Prosopis cineraria]